MSADEPSPPPFHVWIRRSDPAGFDLRFSVQAGKALLRTVRPGVVIDPPARTSGDVAAWTAAELRSCVFVHVEPLLHACHGYVLADLDAAALERLPAGEWVALEPRTRDGEHALVVAVAGEAAPAHATIRAPEPPPAAAEVPVDDGAPPTALIRHLRRQLARQAARIAELEDDVRRLRGR